MIEHECPSFVCFVKLITGKKYNSSQINKLYSVIDKEDVSGSSRSELIKWLVKKSNV